MKMVVMVTHVFRGNLFVFTLNSLFPCGSILNETYLQVSFYYSLQICHRNKYFFLLTFLVTMAVYLIQVSKNIYGFQTQINSNFRVLEANEQHIQINNILKKFLYAT